MTTPTLARVTRATTDPRHSPEATPPAHAQAAWPFRFDWGLAGRGVAVLPHPWRDERAARYAVEDLWGAEAVLHGVAEGLGPGADGLLSPEPRQAADAYRAVRQRVPQLLRRIAGGREPVDAGFAADVDFAARVDSSTVVPVLQPDGSYAADRSGVAGGGR